MDERFDISTEFARSYLSTPAEKAVYLSLVAATGSPRTIEELAGETDLDPREVANVLERFEAAGIVRSVEEADGTTCYVWDREMEYLRMGSEDPFGWIDPVCGMPVRPETPYTARGPHGGERRFCSASCLATFRKAPMAFDGTREDPTSPAWAPRPLEVSESAADEIATRLRRVEDQVAGIRSMYETGRYGVEVVVQISAARARLHAAALEILVRHVSGSVEEAIEGGHGDGKATEFLAPARRVARSV